MKNFYIGTAAWAVPKEISSFFPAEGSILERYAQVLPAVEINTSFYRHHKAATYARWANAVPENFRFSVKLAKEFTHERRLEVERGELQAILHDIAELGDKWAVLLVQLPPSLQLDLRVAEPFFSHIRAAFTGAVVCEARHPTWFTETAFNLFSRWNIETVRADPSYFLGDLPQTAHDNSVCYFRWHGAPVIYESRYEQESLDSLAREMRSRTERYGSVWCIFDNTKYGWATTNAIEMIDILAPSTRPLTFSDAPEAFL